MKYKVGDKVRVKEDLNIGKWYGPFLYSENMEKYKGKQAKINDMYSDNYSLDIDDGKYYWTDSMLEPVIENKQFTKKDFKFGDIVTLKNGDVFIYTGISTMRNSSDMVIDIGLYDTDFRYMPIYNKENKDFAIMKIERYTDEYKTSGIDCKLMKLETLYERKEEILDEKEKKYLSKFIEPFRDRIEYITKKNAYTKEWLYFGLDEDEENDSFGLPYFNEYTMYKNMEIGKEYTVEELGL